VKTTCQQMFDVFPKSDSLFYLKVVTTQITFNKKNTRKVESLTSLKKNKK